MNSADAYPVKHGKFPVNMESVLALLKDVLNLTKVATVTVPGLIVAGSLALLLRSPAPVNVIPVVVSTSQEILPPLETTIGEFPNSNAVPIVEPQFVNPKIEYACAVWEYYFLDPQTSQSKEEVQRAQQYILEREQDELQGCIEAEGKMIDADKEENEQLREDIGAINSARLAAVEMLVGYQKSESPLQDQALTRVHNFSSEIDLRRDRIQHNDGIIRERNVELTRLQGYKKVLDDRLADPGRLRPEKPFDEYINSLTNHVIAFILLSLSVGIVLKAITPTASGALYHALFPQS